MLDPTTWRRLGCTLVELLPDGEPFPVEVEDEHRPDGRTETTRLFSPERSMVYAWGDVVAAAVLSGQVPNIRRATRLAPVGREAGLRERLPVLPGLVLDVDDDPVVRLVQHRRLLRTAGRLSEAALLRVVANALCFGILARFDECRRGSGRTTRLGERPGPWNFLPLASSVTAGTHLLLAVFEAMVRARGGCAVYCDTDSWLVPASRLGGTFHLPDGSEVRELPWPVLAEITACFEPLGIVGRDMPVWKCERGTAESPLRSVVFGAKRHVEFVIDDDGEVVVVERTDANLGGFYADPAGMCGRTDDKGRAWSLAAVRREVVYALSRQKDTTRAVRTAAPWDDGQPRPFPALFRRAVVSPEVLESLPRELGARPGSRFLEGLAEWFPGDRGASVVALDPGDGLANWRSLRWFDRRTGARVEVDTDWRNDGAVKLATLDAKGADWSRPPRHDRIDEVHLDPLEVRHVGRVSGLVDALVDRLPGDLRSRRPVYDSALSPLCALDECWNTVEGRRLYCCHLHAERGRKRRQRRTV